MGNKFRKNEGGKKKISDLVLPKKKINKQKNKDAKMKTK